MDSQALVAQCSSTSSQYVSPDVEVLLGILVSVVDEVASNFVFGPYGTAGRPKGVLDISLIHEMASSYRYKLDPACQHRWCMFVQQWQDAGWAASSLIEFADALRPLQYRPWDDEDDAYVDAITKEDLLKHVQALYDKRMFILAKQCDVEDFVKVVDRHFSQPGAVLVPRCHDEYK